MGYREHAPPAALLPYVTCFWEHLHQHAAAPHRVLPDGALDILLGIGNAFGEVVGPMTRALVTGDGLPGQVVGVRFRPGAAHRLLGVAAAELRDDSAPLALAWGRDGRSLQERAAEAPDAQAGVALLAAAVLARVSRAPDLLLPDARVAGVVSALERAGGELPIDAAAQHAGLGARQVERLFEVHVGLRPKELARVFRLQRAVALLEERPGRPPLAWSQLALSAGYADQAHLTREFGALAGLTPAAFARERRAAKGAATGSGDRERVRLSEFDNPGGAPGGMLAES